MKLANLLRDECIKIGSRVDDKAMALCEIAALAKESPLLKKISEEDVLEALQERETTGTTAFGHGIAIPHCRMKGVRDFVVGLLTVPDGVEFDSEDGKKVQLLVFIIAPIKENSTHLRLLSAVSQGLQDAVAVEKMIFAENPDILKQVFLEAAGQEVSEQVPVARDQIQILVQDEQVFRDILKAVSGLENTFLTTTKIQTKQAKLTVSGNKGDWSVLLITERSLRNEVIRRVETVTGSLLKCSGVLVSIQELAFVAGSLEM